MKVRRLRNSTKRGLVYLSVLLLYIIVFVNILLPGMKGEHAKSLTSEQHGKS